MIRKDFLRMGAAVLLAIASWFAVEEYTVTNIEGDIAWDQDGKWVWDTYTRIEPTRVFGWRRMSMEELMEALST